MMAPYGCASRKRAVPTTAAERKNKEMEIIGLCMRRSIVVS